MIEQVIVSEYNKLGGGRYFDVGAASSFAFEHGTQVRSSWKLE